MVFVYLKMNHDEWKREIEKVFNWDNRKIELKKIPQVVKRCPKCGNLSLQFDMKSGRIFCIRCGFEEHVKQVK